MYQSKVVTKSRCTAHCNSGYEFDNGDSTIQKDCDPMTGQYFDGPAFPKCIPKSSPACQNGETCVAPNVCSCVHGRSGTRCESPSGACKPLAALTNGQVSCGDTYIFYRCTAHCNSGYEFDNGESTIQKDCDPMTGQFFYGPAFPKCIPTCSPACQNGGKCVALNVCSCAPGWSGNHCESH
uniref:Wnt inhibitory factor 1-like n=1 Tax=Crassostrea virginica TaxID=6565 RepID=A0A8B8BZE9_CRAVI|nr:wnt inhibitory factor 1-like [Crassostrea virginica]